MRIRLLVLPAVVIGLALPARGARACSGDWPGRDAAHDWPGRLVDSATAIARVRAVGADSSAPGPGGVYPSWIKPVTFAVLEWLRPPAGRPAARPSRLVLVGEADTAAKYDDYNAGPVPYTFVRPDGARGACFAYAYRIGAEYLLLLRPASEEAAPDGAAGRLSPYWAALAPVNEQVRRARDPWVAWVRARVAAAQGRAGGHRPA